MDTTENDVGNKDRRSRMTSRAAIPSFHSRLVCMRVLKRIHAPSLDNLSMFGKSARDFIL